MMSTIIERNTLIPIQRTKGFETGFDNQNSYFPDSYPFTLQSKRCEIIVKLKREHNLCENITHNSTIYAADIPATLTDSGL